MAVTESRSADRKKVLFPPLSLGSRGQVDSGLCDVPGVWREACAREVRCFQEAVPAAEAEGDRQQGALSALLPAPVRAGLLVKRQGAQLRSGWL
jgi:hypothetical protein